MVKYFEDKSKGIVNKELFSSIAEGVAKEFGKVFEKKVGRGRPRKLSNTKSQIRKFYDDVLKNKMMIESAISSHNYKEDTESKKRVNEEFVKRLPYIKMLKAKAAYVYEREKITPAFKSFIEENIDSINDWEDFRVFCDFFEAVVAYSVVHVSKN